jgi:2-methylcitrate dehydratase PrpD
MQSNRRISVSRRFFLHRGFVALGAARLCSPFVIDAGVPLSGMEKLSAYMSEAVNCTLPTEVIEQAKLHILDTLAAMISGSELPPGKAAIQFAAEYGGERVSTIVASDFLCGPIEAAMVNGMLAHSDETDDVHSPSRSHPGCAAIPAALAVGEQLGISGMHFIRAVVLGYDIGPRVVMAVGPRTLVASHKSPFSFAGVFAAGAAAGCAASLNRRQTHWLLDYCAQQCSGILAWQRDTDHIEKGFVFAGMPARSGVTAALLVKSGWTGVNDIFSGEDNFLLAFADHAEPAELVHQLGERYEVTRTDFKKWSVGMPIQAPLDALEALLKQRSFDPAQVRNVVVRLGSGQATIVDNRDMPDICLQHLVAVMLIDKTLSFASAHDKQRMQDPAVLSMRAKVRVIPDDQLERILPRRQATIEITLADGIPYAQSAEAQGTMNNPMSRADVIDKSRELISAVLGSATCMRLTNLVLGLENSKDIRELRPWLTLAAPRG